MYSSSFTGIGRYVHELTHFLFQLRPAWRFTLFLSSEEFDSFVCPNTNVSKICAPEKHYSALEQISFWRKIQKHKFDLFHFPHFNAPLLYRGKSVVTIHDLTISFFPGKKKNSWLHTKAYKLILSRIVKKSQRIITVSQNTKKDLCQMFDTSKDKIEVIWNGLGHEFFRATQNTKQLEKIWNNLSQKHKITIPYFLYTGVHREHKNVVGMIGAFAEFLKKGHKAQLIITGKPDPFYPEVQETIQKLKLQDHIKTVGLVSEEELKALFYYAHAFVFPSFYEGFGLPPLEAMAMEVPVISSNTSSLPEVCDSAALYFDPYNLDQMTNVMEQIFGDEILRKELIQKGKERIPLFSWRKMTEQTIKVYEQALLNTKI